MTDEILDSAQAGKGGFKLPLGLRDLGTLFGLLRISYGG